jgi:hypothetical protein
MSKYNFTIEELREKFYFDPEDLWIKRQKSHTIAGGWHSSYSRRMITFKGCLVPEILIAYMLQSGQLPEDEVDAEYIARRGDNRRENIRLIYKEDDRKVLRSKTSRFSGVRFSKKSNMWTANFTVADRYLELGNFPTEDDAARAVYAECKRYPYFLTLLNFDENLELSYENN